jgi:nucleoside-diphosphate-sugar epimerase
MDSIRCMLDAAREKRTAAGNLIRFIFTSSLAVYGGPLPDVVTYSTIATPEGAYGMGKLVSEMLVNEYTRRGFVDGVNLRLPTIVVRPGVPSAATSAFISGIIREPLHGVEAICPVGTGLDSPELQLAAWVASPETTVANFVIAKHIPSSKFLKHTRTVYLPGFTTTVKEELDALAEVAGPDALKLITFKVCCRFPLPPVRTPNADFSRTTPSTDVSLALGPPDSTTTTPVVWASSRMRAVWSPS